MQKNKYNKGFLIRRDKTKCGTSVAHKVYLKTKGEFTFPFLY